MNVELLTFPNKRLRRKASKVEHFNIDLVRASLPKMRRIMRQNNGAALASIQVGLLWSFFIVDDPINGCDVLLNPSWLPTKTSSLLMGKEGCLSFPGLQLNIMRHSEIYGVWYDLEMNKHEATLAGFPARVFQHETEHLSGVVFINKVVDLT